MSQQFLAVRLATALGHAATAATFKLPACPQPGQGWQRGEGSHVMAQGLTSSGALVDVNTVIAAHASAHFALLCGRLMRATHGSMLDRTLDPTTVPLHELAATVKHKQVAAAVRVGGGDLSACMVRHLLHAMALAGSGTTSDVGRACSDNGGGGASSSSFSSNEVSERLHTLAAHMRLQVPVVLSVLRASDDAAEAFRQGWAAVSVGVFLPWVGQMASMLYEAANAAEAGSGGVGGAAAADPLLGPLTALACAYPQRLYAPLRMIGSSGGGRRGRVAVNAILAPLLAATDSPVVSEFVDALEQMSFPAQRCASCVTGLIGASDC